jgi:hypothetical protein
MSLLDNQNIFHTLNAPCDLRWFVAKFFTHLILCWVTNLSTLGEYVDLTSVDSIHKKSASFKKWTLFCGDQPKRQIHSPLVARPGLRSCGFRYLFVLGHRGSSENDFLQVRDFSWIFFGLNLTFLPGFHVWWYDMIWYFYFPKSRNTDSLGYYNVV